MAGAVTARALGWPGIVRLGLVQSAIGAVVVLVTSLLNRVMVVEYALPAALPAGLVAWHYAVQLSRPLWGHGSDRGRRRTPWIIAGMAVLGAGAMLAVASAPLIATLPLAGGIAAAAAFAMIGAGVGASGTSLLALLAARVAPERRAAAASITWIMMIAGIVVTAGVAGKLIDPFTHARLMIVAASVVGGALLLTILALWGVERATIAVQQGSVAPAQPFTASVREMMADRDARRFTLFIFLSMLGYSMQDLILEPFAGLMFRYSVGQSTQLTSVQHGGVLLGMILVGIGGSAFGRGRPAVLRLWIVGGCAASALALAALAFGGSVGPGWPLAANVAILGFANGVFAVAAIGTMMALAGEGGGRREGIRMGVWGAAQAIAFGMGGLTGAIGVDIGRHVLAREWAAFSLVFTVEAAVFVAAAILALAIGRPARAHHQSPKQRALEELAI